MGHLSTNLVRKGLLLLAACGLVFPSASVAQQASSSNRSLSASSNASRAVLADGTYLFGQTETPNEIGTTYAIFSVRNNRTVGAFYQPRSSFDCFSGQISPSELAVNIVDSYEQTVHPYEVAVSLDNSLVAGSAVGAYTLDGFHRIDELGDRDLEMLAICQADLAEQ